MTSAFFAPELSAIRTIDSCWIIVASPRSLDHLEHAPTLRPRERTRLLDTDHVPLASGVPLVVRVVLLRTPDLLAVERVCDHPLDGDDHGLVHLVADHGPDPDLPPASRLLRHGLNALPAPARARAGSSCNARAPYAAPARAPGSPTTASRYGSAAGTVPRGSARCDPRSRSPSARESRMPSLRTSSGGALPDDEPAPDRQLRRSQLERTPGERLGYALELEHDPAGLDDRDPVLRVPLPLPHSRLGRLLRDRLVGEDTDPDLPATADVTRHRDTGRLDLAVRDPPRLGRLEPVVPEGD